MNWFWRERVATSFSFKAGACDAQPDLLIATALSLICLSGMRPWYGLPCHMVWHVISLILPLNAAPRQRNKQAKRRNPREGEYGQFVSIHVDSRILKITTYHGRNGQLATSRTPSRACTETLNSNLKQAESHDTRDLGRKNRLPPYHNRLCSVVKASRCTRPPFTRPGSWEHGEHRGLRSYTQKPSSNEFVVKWLN